jgi:hypothetical protein
MPNDCCLLILYVQESLTETHCTMVKHSEFRIDNTFCILSLIGIRLKINGILPELPLQDWPLADNHMMKAESSHVSWNCWQEKQRKLLHLK